MFAYRHHRLILPLAPTIGGGLGLVVAASIAVMPAWLLEALVAKSGIAAVLAAAAPPLGPTARIVLLLMGGGGTALFVGLGLWLLLGKRTISIRSNVAESEIPHQRRADAHPDAPPRPPVRAHRDLGAPLEAVEVDPIVERVLPVDLDCPLADFDPAAIPDVPREPIRAVAPLVRFERPQLIDPGDRFETFDPAPVAAALEPTATLHALLDRLERGIARRPARNLEQAIGDFRRYAS
jgi:hypothetical protein